MRLCDHSDTETVLAIINDAAQAYRGVIPEDRYHEPYMSQDELIREMEDGVVFWGLEDENGLAGVMGIQDKGDVALIRHAYVRTTRRGSGLGTKLLSHLCTLGDKPVLIGTWASAEWAIRFYIKNGFYLVPEQHKAQLLQRYWNIPIRQVETSVVLSSEELVGNCRD